ncbi:MAG: efflux RND transporter periplasmic adaptor subunit [Rhodospirillaceae bacterium]|nr:efflux RND transporter periplasmic adaptor subunit [Rhodospirillaceae bacterium]
MDDSSLQSLLALRDRRRKTKLLWIGAAAVAAMAIGIAGWQASAPPVVAVATLKQQPAERVLAVTGRIKPRQSVQVYTRVSGQIVELKKDEGELVVAGEVLGLIDPSRAEAALTQALASVDAQRKVLNQAERDLERAQALLDRGSTTIAAVESATLAVTKGREDLRRLEAVRDEARLQLEERTILSPLTGRILSRAVDPGQVVDTRTVVFDIAPTSAQEVEAEVDESYSMALKLGQDARLAFAGIPDPVVGKLSYMAPEIQTSTGGRLVRFAFTPPASESDTEWPVGLSVDVNIIVDRVSDAITVPREAIRDVMTEPYVLTVNDGKVARQPISFIDWPAAAVIVSAGLKSGDRVILKQKVPPPGESVRTAE